MTDIDPETLLKWLYRSHGEDRELQLFALEQLCMLLLMCDSIDVCFESCPPRTFIPAISKIFLDLYAPINVLEVAARAITYYLDISDKCAKWIVTVKGSIKAMCSRLTIDVASQRSKDLAEQSIKVLERLCINEAEAVFAAGGLNSVLKFIHDVGSLVHKDTLRSAMAVVSRLCGKMEPDDTCLADCVKDLSGLLKHENHQISDGALQCFVSLVDRFAERSIDPSPLLEHGLVDCLMGNMNKVRRRGFFTGNPPSRPSGSPEVETSSVSTTISLLSTLLIESPSIRNDLHESDLEYAIESALQGDERCILDAASLLDLMLSILYRKRKTWPKLTKNALQSQHFLSLADTASERTQRVLINFIRSKDTDALIDAIDSGGIEVNFTDDVGQTLLNWASAFGTEEMVEFFCERGADANKGQKSSSLHYASSFGRPGVVKILLRHGANPYLPDEDGKTPLDKARERNDEGHREVADILLSPGEWLHPISHSSEFCEGEHKDDSKLTLDLDMAYAYVRYLLPVFCHLYLRNMSRSVRKTSLSLITNMTHHVNAKLLEVISYYEKDSKNCATLLVDVVSGALDNEEEDSVILQILNMAKHLMIKAKHIYLDDFARLGVFTKVLSIAKPTDSEKKQKYIEEDKDYLTEDAKKILPGKPYHWHDWSIVWGCGSLYLWSDAAALELPITSNGWFRFILDGKFSNLYSSGSPTCIYDESDESYDEFWRKFQNLRSQVKSGHPSQPILTSPGGTCLVIGSWMLFCERQGEIRIHNSLEEKQFTILKEDLPGFIFSPNSENERLFTAVTSLEPNFATGWANKRGKRLKSKFVALKQKV